MIKSIDVCSDNDNITDDVDVPDNVILCNDETYDANMLDHSSVYENISNIVNFTDEKVKCEPDALDVNCVSVDDSVEVNENNGVISNEVCGVEDENVITDDYSNNVESSLVVKLNPDDVEQTNDEKLEYSVNVTDATTIRDYFVNSDNYDLLIGRDF